MLLLKAWGGFWSAKNKGEEEEVAKKKELEKNEKKTSKEKNKLLPQNNNNKDPATRPCPLSHGAATSCC